MALFPARMKTQSSFNGDTKSVIDCDFGTVLVIYTGGTIGMKHNNQGVYVSEKEYFHPWLAGMPMFHSKEYAEQHKKVTKDPPLYESFRYHPLYMPVISGKETKYITYLVYEYQHLIDSSNMDADFILQIALHIKKFYRKFDAFVILHGTDTMSYTACSLSFILENLGKPVILTGAQIPIYETRSDGRDNLLGALIMAASFNIPEVCVFFNNELLRGNRTQKVSADTLNAYESPNFPALGALQVNVTVYWDLVQRPSATKPFHVHTLLSPNVAVLRVFPNLSASVVRAFLQAPIEGIVMQCYGAGNFPDENLELLDVLKDACNRGVLIVNTTQCRRGAVSISYAGAKSLLDVGILAGYDMTSEAALAKLSYVLTKNWSIQKKKEFMSSNIRGELTAKENLPRQRMLSEALSTLGLDLDMVGKAVESMAELRDTMILPLMGLTIKRGDLDTLEKICEKYPGNILTTNYDHRTPLHIAIRDGTYEIVLYLIQQGASVHSKDGFNRTPLKEAIYTRRFDVIELLRASGAHLSIHPEELAVELNQAASRGDLELIKAFWNAGAKLNVWDYSLRTPLHVAVLNGRVSCVEYMLTHGANPLLTDDSSRTVYQLTVHLQIIVLLEAALKVERWTKFRRRSSQKFSPDSEMMLSLSTVARGDTPIPTSDTLSVATTASSSADNQKTADTEQLPSVQPLGD